MNQHVFQGNGSLHSLPQILELYGAKRIMLFSGRTSYEQSGAKKILLEGLKPYAVRIHTIASSYPTLDEVKNGVDEYQKFNPDMVVAVGGGNVIDTAKLVNIFAHNVQHIDDIRGTDISFDKCGSPLIAVPTTAGSGSECTHFAVIYVDGKKYSVASPFILPKISIVDPTLLLSLPKFIKATSGADALCQAIESLWSVGADANSRYFASEAIVILSEHLENWVNHPTERLAQLIAHASFLAGRAINISKTTAPHALSYTLTSDYGIVHGEAVAIFLPYFIVFNDRADEQTRSSKLTKVDFAVTKTLLYKYLSVRSSDEAKEKLLTLFSNIGLKTTLEHAGVHSEQDRLKIIHGVNVQRLNNNPRMVTHADLVSIVSLM